MGFGSWFKKAVHKATSGISKAGKAVGKLTKSAFKGAASAASKTTSAAKKAVSSTAKAVTKDVKSSVQWSTNAVKDVYGEGKKVVNTLHDDWKQTRDDVFGLAGKAVWPLAIAGTGNCSCCSFEKVIG